MNLFWLLIGIPIGVAFWWLFLRPLQLNVHERRRREFGLPPKRELPEDKLDV